jgi:cytidine deaminase
MTNFTLEEKKLIEYAKKKIFQYSKMRKEQGLYDIIYAFVLSESGKIYNGACFESTLPQCNICAERHAIANLILAETEKARIKCIFVAGPVPRKSKKTIAPCGMCRHVINEFSTQKTSIICSEFIRNEKNWEMFPRIDKYKIKELYPHPYEPINWD